MHYIVQENLFSEENYDNLIIGLDRLKLPYEIVKVLPFIDDIKFKTNRKDVFPFGSIKMARVSKNYGWKPGSQMNSNHDFLVYKDYYKENLLNWDSKIIKFGDENFFSEKLFFARPTKDTKVFTGQVFDMDEWREFRDRSFKNGHSTVLDSDTEIQISSVKQINQEIRFWIVKGEIITASQYKLGYSVIHSDVIDKAAYSFCNKMIKLFELNDAFVMDLALINNGYKIIECGCINCAGFYKANMQKLLMSLEDSFK
jgi:ATP-grasp domain, R2K clade family 3